MEGLFRETSVLSDNGVVSHDFTFHRFHCVSQRPGRVNLALIGRNSGVFWVYPVLINPLNGSRIISNRGGEAEDHIAAGQAVEPFVRLLLPCSLCGKRR